jgi:hypothetical protein
LRKNKFEIDFSFESYAPRFPSRAISNHLFRAIDISHMKRLGVGVDEYAYMSNPDNANSVLANLSPHNGKAPSGPFWTAE